ncbi:IQ domain-containing protein E-like [Sinocyclocheilus grahami]|uniref:IQ domain-containing protein E-like n=1 Tax=Sinocyclocheilus grahami TaxID=75366 RepID=UPI0007ACD221|nr:PREDICTED: IQ domain-containing protein E-like [Sinocyclocheilus grahami]
MSVVAGEVVTEEEVEDLAEDSLCSSYVPDTEKKLRKKKVSGRPPPSPRSPYLNSASLHLKRTPVASWRTVKGTQLQNCKSPPAGTPKDVWLHLQNDGHAFDPEYARGLVDRKTDPRSDPEYARGLVDRKTDPRSIINGLKQRIVRLEQQYKEKENALSQLQSDLKTTNMQEMKITVETYFEEVQRLRALLESTERSNKAESKNIRRQNKTLSATVLKLTNTVQHLENENQELKKELTQEEMNMMESPACRAKGYMDWSKQRLVRRILELEKRVEQITKASDSLKSPDNKGTQSESANQSDSVNTEMEPSVITENDAHLKETVKKLEEEKKELEGKLTQKDEEIKQLSAEKDTSLKEVENMLKEQIREHERLMQTHRQEMGALTIEISCLKEKLEEERKLRLVQDPSQVLDGSLSLTLTEPLSSSEVVPIEKNRAAKIIQTHWRSHRTRDLVLLQSCLRGHLIRQRQLDGQRQADPRTVPVAMSQSGMNTRAVQEEEVTLLQSAFRAHLKRSTLTMDRVSAVTQSVSSKHQKKLCLSKLELSLLIRDKYHVLSSHSKNLKIHQHQPGNEIPKTIDSDDSDDIIVSPSKPLRKKKILKPVQ